MRYQSRIAFRSIFRVKVSNPDTGQLIGYIGDISEDGLKLLSDSAVDEGKILNLRLKMRVKEDEILQLDVLVRCKWSEFNAKNGYVESGFLLEETSAEFAALVEQMRILRARQDRLEMADAR